MPPISSDALVLRTYKLGETSKVVVLLTRERGKVRAVAKGARGARPRYQSALEPLLQRIHRATRHAGKHPRHRRRSAAWHSEVVALRQQLREAVQVENYEEAARIRDTLRQKEATDEPG